MTTTTAKSLTELTLSETLAHQAETHQELLNCLTDHTTDSPSFRALTNRLNDLNVRLVVLGYRG